MELTKEAVKHCRCVGALRDFLCQAMDQIDEKDKEIAELKAKIEDVQNTAYTDSVDAGMRERKLKRAILVVKAERFKSGYFHFDLEKDFWADRGETDKENHYYEKREQCARLEKICRQRAKELE